jgi:hypothetical protein
MNNAAAPIATAFTDDVEQELVLCRWTRHEEVRR